jgi:two-component system sensor histidine kinase KdpD
MAGFFLNRISKPKQYLISLVVVLLVSAICYSLSSLIGYKVVALILLVSVSLIAMFFDFFPVMLSAVLSALTWNYFFIPPKFTFHVNDTEDALMLLMYFFIAMVNATLTYKIRQVEKIENKREGEENTLKLYNTLLNSLSHELRTPISTIIAATDNLQAENSRVSEENKEVLVNEISKASLRLNRQVENLLNMSRLESGVILPKKDWVDINELVHGVVNRLKEIIGNRVVNIQVRDNLPLFKLDHGLMEQILQNLVHNAAVNISKYCVITVRAMCVEDKLILVVEDTGEGFPPGEIEKVFEKFYRLKNSKTGGTGLGLSIVKGFVEAQHGKIKLENIEEGGARFTIEIPTEIAYPNTLRNE